MALHFDRQTGALWIGDVGQDAREEIDYLRPGTRAGANFGWNGYEGTRVYDSAVASRLDKSLLIWPVSQYGRTLGYSVTGGYVYRGGDPALRGFYLFADFGSGHVWAKRSPGARRFTLPGADNQVSQILSFGQDATGELYVVSLAGPVYSPLPDAGRGDAVGKASRRLSAGVPPGTSSCGGAADRSPAARRSCARPGRGSRRRPSRA